MAIAALGCRSQPKWSSNQAVLASAEFDGEQVTVHNIRNTEYRTADDYTVHYYDKTFDLKKLDSVDFIVVPFDEVPGGAHTFLSFGFDGTDYVAISVELRRHEGEDFSPLKSFVDPRPIMYVVGDERDLIQLRSIYWMSDVYMYRAQASRAQMQALFTSMLERANKLRREPENYNLITNNCTTNIVRHVNELSSERIPFAYQVTLPAFSDEAAYKLKLIKVDDNFERTRREARINELAYVYRDSPDFSVKIREGSPTLITKSWDSNHSPLR